ncbi:MAG: isopeptide-forming domain-containing fimbrial protein, partial [Psychromonas sp.]
DFNYTINPTVPEGIAHYISFKITDSLDTQLTYLGEVAVSYNGVAFVEGTDYTLSETVTNGFSVDFTTDGLNKLADNRPDVETATDLKITFQAEINNTAIMGNEIQSNATLYFNNGYTGDMSTYVIEENQPVVHTGGRQFTIADNVTGLFTPALAEAEFVVKNSDGEYMVKDEETGHITWVASVDDATKLTVDSTTGAFEVKGLAYGDAGETFTYTLEEVTTPDGYVTMNPVTFEINGDSYGEATTTDNQIIRNAKRPIIPQTGGMGTVLFTVVGLAMMSVAVISLRKKEKIKK